MGKKKHEWTRKGVTASMAVVLAFGMVPAVPGVALAATDSVDAVDQLSGQNGVEEGDGEGSVAGTGTDTSAGVDSEASGEKTVYVGQGASTGDAADGTKNNPYASLDQALFASEFDDGDTICLLEGEYAAPSGPISKRVNLVGSGYGTTTIKGEVTYLFDCNQQDETLKVSGITFEAGNDPTEGLVFTSTYNDADGDGKNLNIDVSSCKFDGWQFGVAQHNNTKQFDLTVSSCIFNSWCGINFMQYEGIPDVKDYNTLQAQNGNVYNGYYAVQIYGFNKNAATVDEQWALDHYYRTYDAFASDYSKLKNMEADPDAYAALDGDTGVVYIPYSGESGYLNGKIGSAEAGSIVHLAPGEYSGDIAINKSLTIMGANAGVNPNAVERSNESILTGRVSVNASDIDVAFDGLKFTGTSNIGDDGFISVYHQSGVDLTVSNCVADDLSSTFVSTLGDGRNGTFVISNNRVTNISDKDVNNNASAFNLWGASKHVITGNYVDSINYHAFNLDSIVGDVVFQNNMIRNTGKGGIQIAGSAEGATVNIANNFFENVAYSPYSGDNLNYAPIRCYGDIDGATFLIEKNQISNSATAIWLQAYSTVNEEGGTTTYPVQSLDATIAYNKISVKEDAPQKRALHIWSNSEVNASCNYWGSAVPDFAELVYSAGTGKVIVEPYYRSADMNYWDRSDYVPPAPAPSEPEGEVTENPDGSTTTTVTEDDGTSVETTVSEDEGVTTVVEKDEDGAVTSVSATVTEEAVEAAGGKAVALPFAEPIVAASSDKAVEIEVEAPAGVKVAVPVAKAEGSSSVAPGAVLVLVDAEGNETVLPKTANTGEALSAEIPGDCTLKVVDASADFPDVASDDWYEEQGVADFISARGIMTGVEVAPGSFEFQGDAPTNRGMFVTMLNRLEMEAKASSGEGFADVDPESWYADSSAWAVEAGIATGYENADGSFTFDGEGKVTREQMVTFLFRYAQWLGLDTSARAEGEIEGVSDFAKDAVSWAVAEGLIKGDDETGAIRPADGATRAEAAAVVMRMIELMA